MFVPRVQKCPNLEAAPVFARTVYNFLDLLGNYFVSLAKKLPVVLEQNLYYRIWGSIHMAKISSRESSRKSSLKKLHIKKLH